MKVWSVTWVFVTSTQVAAIETGTQVPVASTISEVLHTADILLVITVSSILSFI